MDFKKLCTCLIFFNCFAFSQSYADNTPHPDMPRVYSIGSYNDKLFGYLDNLFPIISTNNQLAYTDLIAKGGIQRGYLLSVGGGERYVIANENILGGYVFIDRDQQYAETFGWSFHPGIELITNQWDFHLNGYLPFQKSKLSQQENGLTIFSFHQQYDGILNTYSQFAKGIDAIVGLRIPHFKYSRIYGATYLYNYRNAENIHGVEFGIETPLSKYVSLVVRDSYDDFNKNEFNLGFSITLGDVPEMNKHVARDRILEPVRHFMGTLNQGTGTPVQTYQEIVRGNLVRDNIWFFDPNSSTLFNPANGTQNCTFEHPCSGSSFSQTTVDSINTLAPNPNLYIDTGTINFAGQFISIPNGTNIFGRTNNFAQSATGSTRPLLQGTLLLNGNNTLDSLRIAGSDLVIPGFGGVHGGIVSPSAANGAITLSNLDVSVSSSNTDAIAVDLRSTSVVTITNSQFSSNVSSATDDFAIALSLGSNVTSANISNSIFNAVNTGAAGSAQGIDISGNDVVTINSSTINVSNLNGTTGIADDSTIGILLNDNSTLVMNNSTLNTSQQGGLRDSSGIKLVNTSTATINNSTFNIQANQAAGSANATDILAGTGGVTFNNSTITVTNPLGVAQLDKDQASTLNNTTATCNGGAC